MRFLLTARRMLRCEQTRPANPACKLAKPGLPTRPANHAIAAMKHRATVLCVRANRILLVARPNGRWALPGGRCKTGEPAHAAALRELAEETRLSGIALDYVFEFWGARTRHYVFAAHLPPTAVALPDHEISRCRWIRAKDVGVTWVSISTRGIVQVLLGENSPVGPGRRSSPLHALPAPRGR